MQYNIYNEKLSFNFKSEYTRIGRCYRAKSEYTKAYKAFLEAWARYPNILLSQDIAVVRSLSLSLSLSNTLYTQMHILSLSLFFSYY
jgi:hypothetical protein